MIQSLSQVIHESLGLGEIQLQRLILRSPHSYKIYTIPKKSGGVRTIAQPAKETKFLQYWLISNVFSILPVHANATAYKIGASIKVNALAHARNPYLSKFDFQEFFGSIKQSDLVRHFSRHLEGKFSDIDLKNIARLACISPKDGTGLCLSIGAPSSPILSNSIMYEFDCAVQKWCDVRRIAYTRYADDLTFSTSEKNICYEIEPMIRGLVLALGYPKLRINDKKTIHLSRKNQRRVTGIIINNEGEVSIGRARKRTISALIHHFSTGKISLEDGYKLNGLLGFSNDVEPEFVERMRTKFGHQVIDAIFKIRKPSKLLFL
jgi:RNA-directed DNA polymerase